MFKKNPTKKICLIFCGGTTLNSSRFFETSVLKKEDIKNWMAQVPELEVVAEIDPLFFAGENQNNFGSSFWTSLAKLISQKLNDCDGFVIIHPLNSIIFTACALSFSFLNLNKPIIFTGSLAGYQTSGCDFKNYEELGFKANLINAVHIATQDLAEVALAFGNSLIRATQAQQNSLSSLDIFSTLRGEPLAKIDFGINLSKNRQLRKSSKPKLVADFDDKVFVYETFPGSDHFVLSEITQFGYHGIIIKTQNTNLKSFFPHFEDLAKTKTPVIFYSPYFQNNLKKESANRYPLIHNATFEATLVKFMWALVQTKDQLEINKIMTQKIEL